MSDFPPIAELVPHGGPMVLLDAMVRWDPGEAACVMVVREGAPFVVDGALALPLTIEHMAQTVASCLGYEAFRGGVGVRVGMIIACRRFEVHGDDPRVGDEIRLVARRIRGNDTLSHFACEVRGPKGALASAELTLFHGEEPPA